MSLNLGQSLHPGQTDEETRVAGEAIAEGDAVTINSSDEIVKSTDTNGVVYGVAGDDHVTDGYVAGDFLTVITAGPVVANVAAGVGPAVELAGSVTAGELAAGDSAKALVTKHPEGVGQEGDIPDGSAHVDV